jgi:hypothetical protein
MLPNLSGGDLVKKSSAIVVLAALLGAALLLWQKLRSLRQQYLIERITEGYVNAVAIMEGTEMIVRPEVFFGSWPDGHV